MGDTSIGFVSKTLEYAQSHPDFAPKYFNVNDALIDFRAVPVLREFSTTVNVLADMLQDTMTASGSEAYAASLLPLSERRVVKRQKLFLASTRDVQRYPVKRCL
jgi:hypothetical protein